MLRELIPTDLVRLQNPKEWKESIVACYNRNTGKTSDDSKIALLQLIFKWPTFGSAFYVVKVSYNDFSFSKIRKIILVVQKKKTLCIVILS